MKPAVLFDLGITLASYYHANEFTPILKSAIRDLWTELTSRGLFRGPFDVAFAAAIAENAEAPDCRFTPISAAM